MYSRFNSETNTVILGDGEYIDLLFKSLEKNSTPTIQSIKVDKTTRDESRIPNTDTVLSDDIQNSMVRQSDGSYRIFHNKDYYYNGSIDNMYSKSIINQYSRSVLALPRIGTVKITYVNLIGTIRTFEFPLYAEIRDCSKNY